MMLLEHCQGLQDHHCYLLNCLIKPPWHHFHCESVTPRVTTAVVVTVSPTMFILCPEGPTAPPLLPVSSVSKELVRAATVRVFVPGFPVTEIVVPSPTTLRFPPPSGGTAPPEFPVSVATKDPLSLQAESKEQSQAYCHHLPVSIRNLIPPFISRNEVLPICC